MLKNLATRREKRELPALASSLVLRKRIRITAAAIPIAAVNPIAAIAVTVVTVVVDTVVTITLSYLT